MNSLIPNSVEARRSCNRLLMILRDEDWRRLAPHLEYCEFARDEVLFNEGEDVTRCCFPCDGLIASLRISDSDGAMCEVCTIGQEGAAGGIISNGHAPAFTSAVIAAEGSALCIPVARLDAVKEESPRIQSLFARYADCLLAQIMQSSACNALHGVEQRIARWLLAFDDRIGGGRINVTQETLAAAIGVGRPYASRQLKSLECKGLIRLRRGAIEIRDRRAVENYACTCYGAVRGHFATVISGLYPPAPSEAMIA
ncbi:MAG: Crp/Fnr family transcriptional regulator [Beijerinckiaceae bacterium]